MHVGKASPISPVVTCQRGSKVSITRQSMTAQHAGGLTNWDLDESNRDTGNILYMYIATCITITESAMCLDSKKGGVASSYLECTVWQEFKMEI